MDFLIPLYLLKTNTSLFLSATSQVLKIWTALDAPKHQISVTILILVVPTMNHISSWIFVGLNMFINSRNGSSVSTKRYTKDATVVETSKKTLRITLSSNWNLTVLTFVEQLVSNEPQVRHVKEESKGLGVRRIFQGTVIHETSHESSVKSELHFYWSFPPISMRQTKCQTKAS